MLRHLAETGAIQRQPDGWVTRLPVDQLGIPQGVREAVGHRLSRLSSQTNQALRVAAVAGAEFELGVVQAAGELSEDVLLGAVEEAVAARLVSEVSATRFRFAHALVRATLYESLTAARQVALHRRTAEAIESIHEFALDDYLPALAHHWGKASAPVTDTTRAVEYARRAGDRALAQLANNEAANYYVSGLDLLDAAGAGCADLRRVELLIGLGEAQRRIPDPAYRDTLLNAARLARELGDAHALARAALANTLGHMWTGVLQVDEDRVEMLEAAIAAIGEDDRRIRARLLATLGLELGWQPDHRRRLELSEEALRISRSLDDPETLAHVLLARDYTITAPENASERLANTTELLTIAERLGDPVVASRALSLRFKAAMELADVDEAERSVARNDGLVADLGQPMLTWSVKHHQATLAEFHGSPDAEMAIRMATELAPVLKEMFFFAHLLTLRIEQGRAGEIEGWIGQTAERTQQFFFKSIHARVLLEVGRTDAAARAFEEFAAADFAHPTFNASWLMFEANCAWLCSRLDRADCADILRVKLEPYADQLVVTAFGGNLTGTVAHYLALLATTIGDWPSAEARFVAAAATHERVRAPLWLARTRLEWARMLQKRGEPEDRQRAGALLGAARAAASELGLAAMERQATELLARS